MRAFPQIRILCAVGVIGILASAANGDPNTWMTFKPIGWKSCLGQALDTPSLKTATDTCLAELKATIDLGSPPTPQQMKKLWKKDYCFRACQLTKLGLVTESNSTLSLVQAGIPTFVEATYPAALRPAIRAALVTCANATMTMSNSSSKPAASKNEKCGPNKPIIKCIDKAVKKSCKPAGRPGTVPDGPGTPVPMASARAAESVIPLEDADGEDDDEDDEDEEDDDEL